VNLNDIIKIIYPQTNQVKWVANKGQKLSDIKNLISFNEVSNSINNDLFD